jgi:hypothetical protein
VEEWEALDERAGELGSGDRLATGLSLEDESEGRQILEPDGAEAGRYAAAWKDRKRRFIVYVATLYSFFLLPLLGILDQRFPALFNDQISDR